ncbi:hypothetical protein ACHAXR_010641 [Thalassiosira sp. AJA248-18]
MTAMKVLTLVGAATAVSAASSSSSRIFGATSTPRSLQDDSGNSYTYLDDLTGYSLKYSNCLRVKIPQDNDDDEVDGNVNFYNGRYHAQYQIYAMFHVCGDGSGGGDQCYDSCDYGVEYATDMVQYLETSLNHWDNYCNACQEACGGGRKLEDNQAAQMDCSTCSSSCANYYKDNGNDESAYMECAAGAEDEDGLQLYYGPQCSDDGNIIIGVFYDDECTIKTKHDSPNFDYYKFGTVGAGCVDCSSEAGEETCGDLYGDAFHCLNGRDQQGQDDEMSVCKAVSKHLANIDYSGVKKRHHGADTFVKVLVVLLSLSFVGGIFFLTYTYYVRHRGEKSQPMLSSEDVHEEEDPTSQTGGTLT